MADIATELEWMRRRAEIAQRNAQELFEANLREIDHKDKHSWPADFSKPDSWGWWIVETSPS